jgi:cystathionine beta-lyase/cystathionine gamma-synthase
MEFSTRTVHAAQLDGSLTEVVSLVSSFRFFTLGEGLGGVKSLVWHPARMTHASIPAAATARLGLSDSLLRFSPGCEHHKDLVRDLVAWLAAIEQSRALSRRRPLAEPA